MYKTMIILKDLHNRFKLQCVKDQVEMKDVLNNLVEKYLAEKAVEDGKSAD